MSQPDPDTTPEVLNAARSAALDIDALASRVDKVLEEPLYWFPVRHHSPTIARHIAQCIRDRKPKIIFIEGPFKAQEMIEFLVDSKTRPPVAIYSSFRDDSAVPSTEAGAVGAAVPRFSVWYPLVSYSPEYVAMSTAGQVGAQCVFMDLPHYAIEKPAAPPDGAPRPTQRRNLDEIALTSSFYQLLAKSAGYRSWDETWDRLFETPRSDQSCESYRREIALFCAAVRATTPVESLQFDGTLARERFMWKTIRQTLENRKIKPEEAMVICGGFHLFLDRNDPEPPPPIPQGTLSVTLAPYSYFRISQLSGYGAGNRAPRFYELCYEHHSAGLGQDHVVIDYVVDCLKEAPAGASCFRRPMPFPQPSTR